MEYVTRLAAVKYGETYINEAMAYQGGDLSITVPISLIVYLIETADKKILIDAGCDTMPGFELSHFSSPADTLRRAGIEPESITDVILTHSHHDHAEASHHFKNATIHIEKDEYDAARRFLPESLAVNVFENELIFTSTDPAATPNSELRTPHSALPSIRAIKIGGHSKGSCVVEFTYRSKPHVICGDECYVRRCLDEKIPTGASYSPEKSLAFVEKYGSGDYVTLLCHDPEIMKGENGVHEL